MNNWNTEFQKWAPDIPTEEFHGASVVQREKACERIQRSGGVLITTYGMLQSCTLREYRGRQFIWDYFVLDDGHKIKNTTQTATAAKNLPSRNRIIITGKPIHNHLGNLWSLFEFVHQGSLLGTARTFKTKFENPIVRSRQPDANLQEQKHGQEMSNLLAKEIGPYFLRRTKAEVFDGLQSDGTHCKIPKRIGQKRDFVIWVCLSRHQVHLYENFLELDQVKDVLMTTNAALVQLLGLKRICDHPRLLLARECSALGLDHEENHTIVNVSDETLINESGKLSFLINLLDNLKFEGHRCVVFSKSREILQIIQQILINKNFKVLRMDGTVRQPLQREQLIRKFHTDTSYTVFLLTTEVGGSGISLTAADRVILYDPSWNPAVDSQAVDRVHQIGQSKVVVIYRLITCSTVEEKIYKMQIFKSSINKQTVERIDDPTRYCSKQELMEMFTLENPATSCTQLQLEKMHVNKSNTSIELDQHIAFLHSLDIFGISDHDLLFTAVPEAAGGADTGALLNCESHLLKTDKKMAEAQIEVNRCKLENTGAIQKTDSYVRPLTLARVQRPLPQEHASRCSIEDFVILAPPEKIVSPHSSYLEKKKADLKDKIEGTAECPIIINDSFLDSPINSHRDFDIKKMQ